MTIDEFERLVVLVFVPTSDFPVSKVLTTRDMSGSWVPGVQITPMIGESHVWPKFYPFELIEPLTEEQACAVLLEHRDLFRDEHRSSCERVEELEKTR